MNRREMLKAAGFAASSVALESATGNSAAASQPGRKYKIIITGGHPGDPEYGCGGSVARFTALGHEVVLLYLNDGAWETSAPVRIAEAKKACEILKARPLYAAQTNGHAIVDNAHYQAFQKLLEQQKPDALFTHWPIDNHPDHRAVANLTFEAWKQLKHRFALYYYEGFRWRRYDAISCADALRRYNQYRGREESCLLRARHSESGLFLWRARRCRDISRPAGRFEESRGL